MTANEAHEVHNAMRQFGISGAVAPADADELDGSWVVVDEAGQDVTDSVLARVAAACRRRPARGFVIAR